MDNRPVILVIDDEEIMRDSCSQILAKEGHTVETAENGTEGLDRIKSDIPDIALVDLKMPGIDGLELLELIRDVDPEIVSIVITGYPTIESAVEAMKRGAYDFLPKPFSPDELRIIVRRGLERRKLSLESARLRQEKERMKEYFITLVTHELRSPLVTIQQYFHTVLGGFTGEINPQQKEIFIHCQERVKSLLDLIEDWLSVTRIEKGAIVGKLEPLSLPLLLNKVIDSHRSLAEKKNVSIKLDTEDDVPPVLGDPETLEIVFNNLVTNGIKFNVEGGVVELHLWTNGVLVSVTVSDTGIGIPRECLPYIFEEFYRVKEAETTSIGGSGMGLPIAKKIVEAHSGTIEVSSEPQQGSTFTVSLPIAKDHEKIGHNR